MGNIKVDEVEFLTFLNRVNCYVEQSKGSVPEEIRNSGESIQSTIIKYQNRLDLKLKRKAYYEFYINNRVKNPEEANKAYRQYLKIKEELREQI